MKTKEQRRFEAEWQVFKQQKDAMRSNLYDFGELGICLAQWNSIAWVCTWFDEVIKLKEDK